MQMEGSEGWSFAQGGDISAQCSEVRSFTQGGSSNIIVSLPQEEASAGGSSSSMGGRAEIFDLDPRGCSTGRSNCELAKVGFGHLWKNACCCNLIGVPKTFFSFSWSKSHQVFLSLSVD